MSNQAGEDPSKSSLQAPSNVLELLKRLHKVSLEQEAKLTGFWERTREVVRTDPTAGEALLDDMMRDKFIALFEDKACFVYNLIRASGALNVVEAGTSFGVSTIYLALAVGQNAAVAGKKPGEAKVIATEFEPTKAEKARQHWQEAGESVLPWIELREGDLRETLKKDLPIVDFVLFDIWTPVVLATLKVVEPRFRPGTVLIADNIIKARRDYAEFIDYINAGPYTTLNVPFTDGLWMVVYSPRN